MADRPSPLVMAVRALSIGMSLVAPGAAALEVSFTTPEMVLCAVANDASAIRKQTTKYACLILFSPFSKNPGKTKLKGVYCKEVAKSTEF
jgi:hypothetical protein